MIYQYYKMYNSCHLQEWYTIYQFQFVNGNLMFSLVNFLIVILGSVNSVSIRTDFRTYHPNYTILYLKKRLFFIFSSVLFCLFCFIDDFWTSFFSFLYLYFFSILKRIEFLLLGFKYHGIALLRRFFLIITDYVRF